MIQAHFIHLLTIFYFCLTCAICKIYNKNIAQEGEQNIHCLQITAFFSRGVPCMKFDFPQFYLLVPGAAAVFLKFVRSSWMNDWFSQVPGMRHERRKDGFFLHSALLALLKGTVR